MSLGSDAMKTNLRIPRLKNIAIIPITILLVGCSNGRNAGVTNLEQPGPAIGRAVGTGTGAVVGNTVAGVVSTGEGFGGATKSAFDNTQRVVRYWHEEQTTDGRIILVPEEYLVDGDGRIIRRVR